MNFKKQALNKAYKIDAETDVTVNIPALEKKHGPYNGPLSGIPEEAIVEGMVERGSNLVSRKGDTPPPGPDSNSNPAGEGETNKNKK